MEKATKLASGNWRCRAFLGTDRNGKKITKSFTAPTKKEAEDLAKKCEAIEKDSMSYLIDKDATVRIACEKYSNKKEQELEKGKISPATVRGYKRITNTQIEYIEDVPCLKLTDKLLNAWVEDLSETYSPKSVRNAWGFVHASLLEILPRSRVIDFRVELPSIPKKKVVVPTEADIHKLLTYCKYNDYQLYCAIMLAAFGTLRRSEICALTAEDIDRENNIISVNKALVEGVYGGYVLKKTKTELSERDIVMPSFVINALPEEGNIINVYPAWISENFSNTLKKLDIPHFRFHDLRHYSASIMHFLGATNETIMHRGGWASDYALNNHYRGNMSEYDAEFTKKLNKHFEKKFAV